MKASELHGMSDDQLGLTLKDTEKHLFQLRFQQSTDRLETPSEIRKAKKDLARIKTEQRRRELEKLPKVTDDVLTKSIAELETKLEGPGKRRAKRSLARLTAIRDTRTAAAKPAATAAKGK
jgi:large subunit ribosomal protein L29